MLSKELFKLLHDYFDEPHISYEELEERAQDLYFVSHQQEYENNSILVGLICCLHEVGDGMTTKDYVGGYIDGVLSVFAPCPVSEGLPDGSMRMVRMDSNAKTEVKRIIVNG